MSIFIDKTPQWLVDIIFDASFNLPAVVLDLNYSIIAINHAANILHEFNEKNVIKKNYNSLCRKNNLLSPFSYGSKALKQKKFFKATIVYPQDSSTVAIEWSIRRFYDVPNKQKIFFLIGQDISRVKYLEKTISDSRIKESKDAEFLSSMAQQIIGKSFEYTDTLSTASKIRFHLENIIAQMPCSVYWKDKQLNYLGCSDYGARLVGLKSRKEIVNKTDYDFEKKLGWVKGVADSFRADDRMVIDTGQAIINREEPPFIDVNGEKIIQLTNRVPLTSEDGKTVGILGVSIDITDRKKAELELREAKEQLEIANKVKSQFITNMEHDIRTPAAGIASLSTILAAEETDPVKKERLNLLSGSAQQLLNVLVEILEFHTIDEGKAPILDKKFNLKKIIQNVVNLEIPAAKMKGLSLESKIATNIPDFVMGDDFRTYRILLNLIGNSIKFTETGKVAIDVSVMANKKEKIMIQILVSDTGIGIPKDKQAEIFESFSRLNPSNEGRYTGSGLGLRIVKQFVTELGGKITVTSNVGKGTTFTCLIPYKKPLASQAIDDLAENATTATTFSLAQTKVLLIEDDPIAKLVGENILRDKFKALLDVVSTGNDAMLISKNKEYDIIFMDLGLPDMDGKKLAAYFRNKGSKIPIIALTAHGLGKKEECIQAGMSDFLIKPLAIEKVVDIIKKWLPNRATTAPKKQRAPSYIDYDQAKEINQDEKLIRTLLEKLSDKFVVVKKDLQDAAQKQDFKKILAIVHNLKGSCSYCGASKLEKSLVAIEKSKLTSKNIDAILKKLFQEIEATTVEVSKLLKK